MRTITLRKKLEMTQEEFAEEFEIPLELIQRWDEQNTMPDYLYILFTRCIMNEERVSALTKCIRQNEGYGITLYNLPKFMKEKEEQEEIAIQEQVKTAFESHKRACEEWKEGDILNYWIDENGYLCIKYESGEWWHYKDLDLPFPTWW